MANRQGKGDDSNLNRATKTISIDFAAPLGDAQPKDATSSPVVDGTRKKLRTANHKIEDMGAMIDDPSVAMAGQRQHILTTN